MFLFSQPAVEPMNALSWGRGATSDLETSDAEIGDAETSDRGSTENKLSL